MFRPTRAGQGEVCCNCMCHSTCSQAVGVSACSCRRLNHHCTSCACIRQCRNQKAATPTQNIPLCATTHESRGEDNEEDAVALSEELVWDEGDDPEAEACLVQAEAEDASPATKNPSQGEFAQPPPSPWEPATGDRGPKEKG
eukprot:10823062-Ditylum_brightwellii.AAC.1